MTSPGARLAGYVVTINEICRMHEDAGLKPVDLLGSTAGEACQMGSPRLILVSESRGL